ncbi:MAG: hypothetical protein OXR62_16695 [Ahrensia sp.]|nr:hypothetical protein [Ahrensia sp.]
MTGVHILVFLKSAAKVGMLAGAALALAGTTLAIWENMPIAPASTLSSKLDQTRNEALLRSQEWSESGHSTQPAAAPDVGDSVSHIRQSDDFLEATRVADMARLLAMEPVLTMAMLNADPNMDHTATGSVTVLKTRRLTGYRPGLERFHARLDALLAGRRERPLTVLHIGGSHAEHADFASQMRAQLQSRFGDAGRGMMMPGSFETSGRDETATVALSGDWKQRDITQQRRGRFGLSGRSMATSAKGASMRLVANGDVFDWAAVTVATGPQQGLVTLRVGDTTKTVSARAPKKGSRKFRIDAKGTQFQISASGEGETTVLNWATGRNKPGVRFVSFGRSNATADSLHRYNARLLENDIRRLAPDLVILSYGTEEALDPQLDLSGYKSRFEKSLKRLKRWAYDANFVFVGAPSTLVQAQNGDGPCNGWSPPAGKGPVQQIIMDLADRHNAAYWDWTKAMGGPCSAHSWALSGLASQDRSALTKDGYGHSAKLLTEWLSRKSLDAVASNQR